MSAVTTKKVRTPLSQPDHYDDNELVDAQGKSVYHPDDLAYSDGVKILRRAAQQARRNRRWAFRGANARVPRRPYSATATARLPIPTALPATAAAPSIGRLAGSRPSRMRQHGSQMPNHLQGCSDATGVGDGISAGRS